MAKRPISSTTSGKSKGKSNPHGKSQQYLQEGPTSYQQQIHEQYQKPVDPPKEPSTPPVDVPAEPKATEANAKRISPRTGEPIPQTETMKKKAEEAKQAEKEAEESVAAQPNDKPVETKETKKPGLPSDANNGDTSQKDSNSFIDTVLAEQENFPEIDHIMGLPPKWKATSVMEELLPVSFPILRVTPLGVTLSESSSDKQYQIKTIGEEYEFCVQADTSVGYSHQNQYAAAGITNNLKQLFTMNTAGELRQMMQTSGNALFGKQAGNALHGIQNTGKQAVDIIGDIMKEHGGNMMGDTGTNLGALGADLLGGFLLGARLDLPNIWTDSSTGMSWTFNIDLYTLATNPASDEYYRDIVQPLEVLLQLALPKSGAAISYTEPPYLKFTLGNFINCRLGGITNLSWNAPLKQLNFYQMVRHVEVSLTVTDLYNVMVKGTPENDNVLTKERFIDHLKTKNGYIPNEPQTIFLTEYKTRGGGGGSESNYDDSDVSPTYNSPGGASEFTPAGMDVAGEEDLLDDLSSEELAAMEAELTMQRDQLLMNLNGLDGNVPVGELSDVNQLTGNMSFGDFLEGISSIPLNAIDSLKTEFMNNIQLDSLAGNIQQNLNNTMGQILNSANMNILSDGLTNIAPSNYVEQIMNNVSKLGGDLIGQVTSAMNVDKVGSIITNAVSSMSQHINGVISQVGTTASDLVSNVNDRIKQNPKLNIAIKTSSELQDALVKTCDTLHDRVAKDVNVVKEMENIKNDIAAKVDPSKVTDEFIKTLDKVNTVAGTSTKFGIKNALTQKRKGKEKFVGVTINVKGDN